MRSSLADPHAQQLADYIRLKLNYMGFDIEQVSDESELLKLADPLFRSHRERSRFADHALSPADQRIQDYLDDVLSGVEGLPRASTRLPLNPFILDRPGMARLMSLPSASDEFHSAIIDSYRIWQGVLHNPRNDRRTTQGVFHVTEGGLPIPDDKKAVPKSVFGRLLIEAFRPPKELLQLPFTSAEAKPAELFVSLLLRPVICPDVPGFISEKSMEIRFFVPGNLVSNLDFVETIFGNAGDPYIPDHDAGRDVEHWSGHTGCVILAPHLTTFRKKDLGLPHYDQANERQRRDGMCWKDASELYNDGGAFKITCRDARGVIVTIIADNYFGYCKKEVKTQISYAANLYGLCEEEHSGGALAYATYDLGEEFVLEPHMSRSRNTMADALKIYGKNVDVMPEGHAVDRTHRDVILVPEDARFNLQDQAISWNRGGKACRIKLLADHTYLLPSGYKVRIKRQTGGYAWHLIGTVPEGVLCHKPCTVSGGGKSEISKSIVDAMIQGPVFVADFNKDMDAVEELLKRDYSGRFRPGSAPPPGRPSRPVLSNERSLGSVIKLFTVSEEHTDEYNAWLQSIPDYIKEILFCVKRFYRADWGGDWRSRFSVDLVNGHPGHELKFKNRKLVANYLRVGREKDGSWRIFRVRTDYSAANKIQAADDITASVTVPRAAMQHLNPDFSNPSLKMIRNCENYLFQRPDDAVYRGFDKQAETDLATPGTFISNFEPLGLEPVRDIVQDVVKFDQFTDPMKKLLRDFAANAGPDQFVVSSAHSRIVDGKPTKNPRYLQKRPDHVNPRSVYIAELAARLRRLVPVDKPVHQPVNAVLPGRRNNPPDRKAGVPALAVYNPVHFQELPELFMDFISSLTGKSPSTTGFGSEGALTKGPFNALPPIVDLNNAFLSFVLTGYDGFSSAASYIGPNYRVDHDISLLVPEIWCRMRAEEQEAVYLIRNGFLERVEDFDHKGKRVQASILGYRITQRFVNAFLGRVFNNPNIVFTREMLKPELQDADAFVEGIENILVTYRRVAEHYFNDGSIEAACPPLKALLHIMAHGHYESKPVMHPDIRRMFERDEVVRSAWYRERLDMKQRNDLLLYQSHVDYLTELSGPTARVSEGEKEAVRQKLADAQKKLAHAKTAAYRESLVGTIGTDPFLFRAGQTR